VTSVAHSVLLARLNSPVFPAGQMQFDAANFSPLLLLAGAAMARTSWAAHENFIRFARSKRNTPPFPIVFDKRILQIVRNLNRHARSGVEEIERTFGDL